MSDRFCLASKGKIDVVLSPQFMVDCLDEDFANACNGAETVDVVRWIGDNYLVDDECYPYYSGSTSAEGECHAGECLSSHYPWEQAVYYAHDAQVWEEVAMQVLMREIRQNGPIYVSMISTEEFRDYSGGVFRSSPEDKDRGGHAVKIIGWGKIDKRGADEPENYYWIGANSWTTAWGEDGYFRISAAQKIAYKAGALTPTLGPRELLK